MWPMFGKLIFSVIDIMWEFELSSFQNISPGSSVMMLLKVSDVHMAIKNKEKHKNCVHNFLYFIVSPSATCDRFSSAHITYLVTHHHLLLLLHESAGCILHNNVLYPNASKGIKNPNYFKGICRMKLWITKCPFNIPAIL